MNSELASAVIRLLVGIATFIIGMTLMSGGLKKATGKSLRKIFKKTQDSRLACFGIGSGVTALIQSSGATCVLAVAFINAGVMTIFQGVNIMIGGFVGTTITGILVSLSTVPISEYFMLLTVVGAILLFFKKEKIKNIGEVIAGLGLIFFGLKTVSGSLSNADLSLAFQNLFKSVSNPLLLLLIGVLVTALLQSSSATTGIIIMLVTVAEGSSEASMPFASALYVSLGATIGTCITTILAAISGNRDGKIAAIVTLFIKIICGLLMLAILWPLESYIAPFFQNTFGTPGFGVAMFTMLYSIVFFAFISMPMVKPLIKLSSKIIRDKEGENKAKQLLFISDKFLKTPDIALIQTKNEIIHMLNLAKENFENGYKVLVNKENININELAEIEDTIDYINSQITHYLIELSNKVDHEENEIVGSYFHVINDIERIGDHAYNFYEEAQAMDEKDLQFSNEAKEDLEEFYSVIVKMFELSTSIFKNNSKEELNQLHLLEDETDKLQRELSSKHYERMSKAQCTSELTSYYITLVSELERTADHLTNIGYSIVDPTGDEI